jgi:hypothetical protein
LEGSDYLSGSGDGSAHAELTPIVLNITKKTTINGET